MRIDALAHHEVVLLDDSDTLDAAIYAMWRMQIRHLPVVRGQVPVGMLSERNLLFHVCGQDLAENPLATSDSDVSLGTTRVDQVMTSPVITISPDAPVEKAARMMLNKRISALLLTNGSTICGIVTETDLLTCFNDPSCFVLGLKCRQSSVANYMASNVFSVGPEDATLTAIRLMRKKQLRHVPVVQDEQLIGIVSDRDILRGASRAEGAQPNSAADLRVEHQWEVQGIMTPLVEMLELSATLADAAQLMVTHKIGAAPIVEHGKLVGMLTETDLLRAFAHDEEA